MKKHYMSAAFAALAITTSSALAFGPDDYIGTIGMTAAEFCPSGTVEANGQILSRHNNEALFVLYGATYGGDGRTTFGVPDLRGRTPVGIGIGIKTDNSSYLNPVALGETRGQESVTLTAKNLPEHTHPFTATAGSQNVTFPETTGSDTTLSGTVGVVPNQGNTGNDFTPVAGNTYQLAGASIFTSQNLIGPYSTAALPATPAKVSGVSVDASGMTPAIPAKTVTITTMTGGTVGANATIYDPLETIPPQLGLLYCIVTVGPYPPQP